MPLAKLLRIGLAGTLILCACTNPFYPVGPDEHVPGTPETLGTPYITMITAADTMIFRLAGSGEAVIDWGYGTPETVILTSTGDPPFNRSAWVGGGPVSKTIRVEGEAILELYCDNINLNLTSLDVSHNPVLTNLICDNNSLTSLDVSHNPALTNLSCNDNDLTQAELETLFGTLPDRTGEPIAGQISFADNPGTGTADTTIAAAKNWVVSQ